MEKNQTSCSKVVCEKIFRAINRQQTPSSAAKHARNPPLPNSDIHMRSLDIKTKLTPPQRPKPSSKQGSEVPIKFDYTTRLPTPPTEKPKPVTAFNGSTHTDGAQAAPLMAQQAKTPKPSTDMVQSGKGKPIVSGNGLQAGSKLKPKIQAKEEGKKRTQHYDDKFSAFIHQTREKIMSNDQDNEGNSQKVVGHGHGVVRKDTYFSDYINQTKRKIRSTLSIKDRSKSFFK